MEKQKKDVRKLYASPEVKRWGTVSDLTKLGTTNPGEDFIPGNGPLAGKPMNGSTYPASTQ